jgi:hypothetical protein
MIALVVGTIRTLINQLDVIVKGNADTLTWVKCCFNYCVPSSSRILSLIAGKRAEAKQKLRCTRGMSVPAEVNRLAVAVYLNRCAFRASGKRPGSEARSICEWRRLSTPSRRSSRVRR